MSASPVIVMSCTIPYCSDTPFLIPNNSSSVPKLIDIFCSSVGYSPSKVTFTLSVLNTAFGTKYLSVALTLTVTLLISSSFIVEDTTSISGLIKSANSTLSAFSVAYVSSSKR